MGKGKADVTTIGKLFNDVKALTDRLDDMDRWRRDITPGGESTRVISKMLEIEKNVWLNAKKMSESIAAIDQAINEKIGAAVSTIECRIARVVGEFDKKSSAIMQGYKDISAESALLAETIEQHIAQAAALEEGRLEEVINRLASVDRQLADLNIERVKPCTNDTHFQTKDHTSSMSIQARSIGRRARSLSSDRRLGIIHDVDYQHGIADLVRKSQHIAIQRTRGL